MDAITLPKTEEKQMFFYSTNKHYQSSTTYHYQVHNTRVVINTILVAVQLKHIMENLLPKTCLGVYYFSKKFSIQN